MHVNINLPYEQSKLLSYYKIKKALTARSTTQFFLENFPRQTCLEHEMELTPYFDQACPEDNHGPLRMYSGMTSSLL